MREIDTTPTDKICPIMSVKMIQWGNVFVECRKECAWYEFCNPPKFTININGLQEIKSEVTE